MEKEKQDFLCNKYETESLHFIKNLNLPVLIPDEEKKAVIKPFEAPQRRLKIKIQLNFYFNKTFRNARDVKSKGV